MSEFVYTLLWSTYLMSTGIAFLFFYNMTKWAGNWKILAGLVRLLFLTCMLVPANLSTNPEFMAPAFVVALFDFLQGYEKGAFDASINLGIALVAVLIIYTIYSVISLIVHSRTKR